MKQHLKKIIVTALLLAILPGILLTTGAMMPDYYGESYYAELCPMYDRLRQVEGPKILVVGGSSVAFGLDTALMEELLAQKGYHYNVCSFGLYAAVGTSAMLDLSKATLNPGDIVILAFEPTSETLSTYFGATAFLKCMENAPELALPLSRARQDALVGNYIGYVRERYEIFTSGVAPQAEGVYARSSFNDRCDLVYPRPGNILPLGYDTSAPVDLGAVRIAPDFAEQVNEYCRAARSAGARVYLSFGPVNRTALVGDAEAGTEALFTHFNETFDCPIISDPEVYILDSGWFYDSNFHLNSAGAIVRTCALTEDILAKLGCYEPLDYALPEMPGSAASVTDSAANTEHFTFEAIADDAGNVLGYRISGLTDSGLEQTELTVPGTYEGKAVVGFTADALEKAEKLTLLRLPGTIESLNDGQFRHCTALAQLILEHESRLCTVTEHTFNGADQLKIFVPADRFALYRDGDGCDTNPWAQYLDRIYPLS